MYVWEHHIPAVFSPYNCFLREKIIDKNPDSEPAVKDDRTWFTAINHLGVISFIRQRENCGPLYLSYLDTLASRKSRNDPLFDAVHGFPKFFDEPVGETGIHACLRSLDCTQDGVHARLQAHALFARQCGFDSIANMFEKNFTKGPGAKCKIHSTDEIETGTNVAMTFLSMMFAQMVAATGDDLPKCFPGSRTNFATDMWTFPALSGNQDKHFGYKICAPGTALFPSQLGNQGADAQRAPRNAIGCQQRAKARRRCPDRRCLKHARRTPAATASARCAVGRSSCRRCWGASSWVPFGPDCWREAHGGDLTVNRNSHAPWSWASNAVCEVGGVKVGQLHVQHCLDTTGLSISLCFLKGEKGSLVAHHFHAHVAVWHVVGAAMAWWGSFVAVTLLKSVKF